MKLSRIHAEQKNREVERKEALMVSLLIRSWKPLGVKHVWVISSLINGLTPDDGGQPYLVY